MGACRRHLELQAQPMISLSQRMRLVRDDPRNISLGETFDGSRGLEDVERKFDFFVAEGGGGDDAKLAAYKRVCNEIVRDDCLLRHITATLDGPEALFSFKKTWSVQLGAESCLSFAFSCVNRSPSSFVFNVGNGKINSTFKPNYSTSGLLETKSIGMPFRLSRNMTKMLGDLMVRGSFVPAIGSISDSIVERKEVMEAMLGLILRDDIVSWHISKSGGKTDAETKKLEDQLEGRINSNVDSVMERFKQMSVIGRETGEEEGAENVVDSGIHKLVRRATDEIELSKCSKELHAWF